MKNFSQFTFTVCPASEARTIRRILPGCHVVQDSSGGIQITIEGVVTKKALRCTRRLLNLKDVAARLKDIIADAQQSRKIVKLVFQEHESPWTFTRSDNDFEIRATIPFSKNYSGIVSLCSIAQEESEIIYIDMWHHRGKGLILAHPHH